MTTPNSISQLETAIATLEQQRPLLGDALTDQALAPLRAQLEQLKKSADPSPPPTSHAPTFEGERRLVTIMFADVSGFTAMSEKMDPEQVRAMMNACFDALVPPIEKYGGTVNKFIGDEIMATFGAPVAHENDPERALRAALEMMDILQTFNTKNNTDLGLHFGINTGLVIAGSIGSQDQQQYDVMGDAVNLAARLEDASERGDIFVGPDTYRLTAPLFAFETLEPVRVKGKSEPVQIYKLLRSRRQPGKVRGLAGLESAMVGRELELSQLLSKTASLQTGQGGAVLIMGEPGLGKTRLIAEWKSAIGETRFSNQHTIVEGRCLSYGQGMAYHLLVDLLHSILNVPPGAEPGQTHTALRSLTDDLFPDTSLDVYPYLAHLLSLLLKGDALERVRVLDPQAVQAQYQNAFRRLVKTLSARQPLIVILEDIHWADPSSTDLLVKLLPLSQDHPLLFCALTRPEQDVPGWAWVTAARDRLGDNLLEVSLQPLTDDASRQLVSNLLEIEELPERIRNSILQKAEGNPFFVEEVIRMLIDRGAIVQKDDKWEAVKEIENVEIPDNLQGLLMARIDRLPEEAKRVLRIASVIGRQFSVKVLEQVV